MRRRATSTLRRDKLGATSWTRTSHTQIFSLLLYLMSYRGIVLAERLRLELRNRITTIERLAIFSNTIMGPFLNWSAL